jgi:hypothetical protein
MRASAYSYTHLLTHSLAHCFAIQNYAHNKLYRIIILVLMVLAAILGVVGRFVQYWVKPQQGKSIPMTDIEARGRFGFF